MYKYYSYENQYQLFKLVIYLIELNERFNNTNIRVKLPSQVWKYWNTTNII